MKRFALTLPIFMGSLLMNPIKGDFLVDGVLTKTAESDKNTCISYVPKIGSVKEGEDINIDSDKFQITEDKRLILYGNVQLDFVDGLLRSQNAELDRENGRVQFSNKGEIFLKDYYFNALKGYLNKDDNSISLNNGMVFSQERNLVFNFDYLTGILDEKILLTNASMSSCADPSSGWILEAEEIALDSTANRGLAKNIKIKAAGNTIFAFPYIPFATSDERMSGFLEPSISYSSDGIDLMIPYYKVISERSDFTVAPRHIAKRGSGFEFNYRSLHGNDSSLRNLDLIYFDKDDELKNEYLKENYSRWAYKYNDTFNFLFTNISIDWSKASDALLLRDIPGDITSIGYQRSQSLNQNISVETKLKNIEITVEHQSYQSLNPILSNGYKKSIGINLNYFKNFGGLSIKERLNIANFNADKIHGYYGYQVHGDS
ncbi:MAG: LPS-assembly protein LptD, partial [Proteobacteria bacterium]|nr:LPS-assembly protein LptD [Pseudomonadota bacterium]